MFLHVKITALCLILVLPGLAVANGPPIHTETAFVTGLNGAAVRSFAKVIRKSGSAGKVDIQLTPIILPYELLDNQLIAGVGMPFLNKTMTTANGIKRSAGYGQGDLFVFAKYNLYQKDKHQETLRLAGEISLSLPTGKDDSTDSKGKLPAGLQRGTGSVNPSVLLVATKLWRRFGINGDIGYTLFPKSNGLDRGDVIRYDLAGSYRLLPEVFEIYPDHQINLMLELNGTYTGESESDGMENPNSGGNIIFASPGIQYIYSTVIVEASVQIPVVESFNGAQLEPDYTALFGFRWLIF